MSKQVIMEFKRGTGVTHTFKLPIADYVAGSKLFFAAKPEIDNDTLDTAAVINKQFTDANVTLDATWATYELEFDAADIVGVTFEDGEDEIDYLGEFEYIVTGEDPVRFPPDNQYIKVKIYAEVRLETA